MSAIHRIWLPVGAGSSSLVRDGMASCRTVRSTLMTSAATHRTASATHLFVERVEEAPTGADRRSSEGRGMGALQEIERNCIRHRRLSLCYTQIPRARQQILLKGLQRALLLA